MPLASPAPLREMKTSLIQAPGEIEPLIGLGPKAKCRWGGGGGVQMTKADSLPGSSACSRDPVQISALPWCDFQQAPLPLSLSFPIKELNLISKGFSGSSVACSAISLLCSQTLFPHPSWGPMDPQQALLHSRLWPGVGGRGCGDYSGPAPHPGLSNRCFLPSTPLYLPAQLSFQPIPIWVLTPEREGDSDYMIPKGMWPQCLSLSRLQFPIPGACLSSFQTL